MLLTRYKQVDAGGGIFFRLRRRRGGTAPERPGDVDIPSECKRGNPCLLHLSESVVLDKKTYEGEASSAS